MLLRNTMGKQMGTGGGAFAAPAPVKSRGALVPAKKKRVPKADFKPGGQKGKLHRELGIPVGQKIPADRLASATKSNDPEVRRDAIRARTMKGWNHKGGGRGAF